MFPEPIQRAGPVAPIWGEPVVDLAEWAEIELIEASLPVRTGDDEPGFAQDLQMLRDRRLTQARVTDQLTHRRLAIAQAAQDLPTMGLSEDGERVEHVIT